MRPPCFGTEAGSSRRSPQSSRGDERCCGMTSPTGPWPVCHQTQVTAFRSIFRCPRPRAARHHRAGTVVIARRVLPGRGRCVGEWRRRGVGSGRSQVDGRTIDSSSMLRRRLSGFEAGEDVSIGMTRAGQQVTPSAIKGHGDGGSSSRRRTTRFEERVAACDESSAAVDRR